MIQPRFNLLDEPWMEVVTADGTVSSVGVLEAFRRADELRGLGQELSTQRFAVLRVLLAFLHRALEGPDQDTWTEAWGNGLPLDRIEAYAGRVRARFWLVHPTAPFFQTPTLRAAKGPEPGLKKIVADLPDGELLFTNRSAADVDRVPWPEAALWLIHAQAYDTAGIKTGALDDPLVIKGKGYGYGLPAWAGQIGGLSAQGATLRETLLLNLIPERSSPKDCPAWERDVTTSRRGATTEEERRVGGPADLMTWQARRILLTWDGDEAAGLTLSQGDRITPQDPPLHPVEAMTAWRYSDPQSKKYGTTIFMPQLHDPARQAWRGLTRLLGLPQAPRPGEEPRPGKVPPTPPRSGLVEHLSELEAVLGLPAVRLELAGYEYGGQNATYADIVDDSLGVPALLVGTGGEAAPWQAAVSQAITEAGAVAYAVRRFAENLAIASGEDRPELPQWQERLFADLDLPIRTWIGGLDPDGSLIEAKTAWQHVCRDAALGLAEELLRSLGAQAHAAHPTKDGEVPITPARAYIWLLAALRKELPLAAPPTQKEHE